MLEWFNHLSDQNNKIIELLSEANELNKKRE